ncbi:MAG: hypothetical protein GX029_08560 [Pseudomonadaceae bacterium]|nr:hypothetical protein [Pseudomonadaceae bacterium]
MKVKKLLERLGQFLDADSKTQQEEIKSIRKVLKVLKTKEHDLRAKLASKLEHYPEEVEGLQLKLDVIYAQRRKGVERVKVLKQGLLTSEKNRD